MKRFINLTPHTIRILAGGDVVEIEPSGSLARVTTREEVVADINGVPVVERSTGDVEGLPAEGTPCIVSAMVLAACAGRQGVYAPDTGASAVRNEKGHIDYVTRLVRA